MPTRPKPYAVLKNEKKSHKTKKELKQREEGEKALISGTALKERDEVKKNIIAHKEFVRLNGLLSRIEKNDAIYETIINRYCLMVAECNEFEEKREKFYQSISDLESKSDEIEATEYFRLQAQMQKSLIDIDKQLQAKRKMLLDIEKENIMTIASALRNIPKKAEKDTNPLLKALNGD